MGENPPHVCSRVVVEKPLFLEEIEHLPAYRFLYRRQHALIEPGCLEEAHAVPVGGEDAVDQAAVEVQVVVERRAEACPEALEGRCTKVTPPKRASAGASGLAMRSFASTARKET